jgi:hypothetical protein
MARIRSIHPGFFTDEQYVTVSAFARLLLLGLLTEADDNGVFEWKPVQIKMRIFPVDTLDIPGLLEELGAAHAIKRVELGGHDCGLIRNFRKYQRPKFPKYRYVLPDEYHSYLGSTQAAGVIDGPDDDPVPRKAEMSPQRERRGEEEREEGRTLNLEQPPEQNNTHRDSVGPVGNSQRGAPYAFEQGVIRLNARDLEKWRRAYPNISLEAELIALAPWAKQQESWFNAVSAALAKRQREAVMGIERVKAEAAAGKGAPPTGQLWDRGI